MPSIRTTAEVAFRYLEAEAREDAVAEIVASAFVAYARLVAQGKADLAFPSVLARFAISQFHRGSRVGSRFSNREVCSPVAQRRHGFKLERLDRLDDATGEWLEAVVDDRSTPVPDQAAFRCDFPAWLRKQQLRNRRIAEALSLGHTTADVAKRFRISPARVSQLRAEFHNSWREFHGE